jgi:hypothetical protein
MKLDAIYTHIGLAGSTYRCLAIWRRDVYYTISA